MRDYCSSLDGSVVPWVKNGEGGSPESNITAGGEDLLQIQVAEVGKATNIGLGEWESREIGNCF